MDVKKLDEPAWDQLVLDYQKSRLTQKDFCEARSINFLDFTYRRQKSVIYKKSQSRAARNIISPVLPEVFDQSSKDGFIKITPEVQKDCAESDSKFIELALPYGIILRIPAHEVS